MSNIQTWLEEVRSGKIKKAFPVLSFPCVHLLNVTVRELLFSSDLQAQGMKLVSEKCNSAAAVSRMRAGGIHRHFRFRFMVRLLSRS